VGQEDNARKADEEMQDDLQLSDQDAEQVTGGSTNNKVVSNPPPALSASMDVKP